MREEISALNEANLEVMEAWGQSTNHSPGERSIMEGFAKGVSRNWRIDEQKLVEGGGETLQAEEIVYVRAQRCHL